MIKPYIRIRIETRKSDYKFKEQLRIHIEPMMYKKILVKYRGKEELETLTGICKRGIEFIRKLIEHKEE